MCANYTFYRIDKLSEGVVSLVWSHSCINGNVLHDPEVILHLIRQPRQETQFRHQSN